MKEMRNASQVWQNVKKSQWSQHIEGLSKFTFEELEPESNSRFCWCVKLESCFLFLRTKTRGSSQTGKTAQHKFKLSFIQFEVETLYSCDWSCSNHRLTDLVWPVNFRCYHMLSHSSRQADSSPARCFLWHYFQACANGCDKPHTWNARQNLVKIFAWTTWAKSSTKHLS